MIQRKYVQLALGNTSAVSLSALNDDKDRNDERTKKIHLLFFFPQDQLWAE